MHHLQRKQCTTNSGMDAPSQTVTMHHGQRSACTIRCGVFTGDYKVSFGSDYSFYADVRLSAKLWYFDTVVNSDGSSEQVLLSVPLVGTFSTQDYGDFMIRNEFRLSSALLSLVQSSGVAYDTQSFFYFDDLEVKFSNIDSLGSTADSNVMSVWTNLYEAPDRKVSPYDFIKSHDFPYFEGDTIITEFPTDWTSWLWEAASGFLDAQILPGLSFSAILAAILGIFLLWFMLHLFM